MVRPTAQPVFFLIGISNMTRVGKLFIFGELHAVRCALVSVAALIEAAITPHAVLYNGSKNARTSVGLVLKRSKCASLLSVIFLCFSEHTLTLNGVSGGPGT